MAFFLRKSSTAVIWLLCMTLKSYTYEATETLDPMVIQVQETYQGSQLSEKFHRNISIVGNDFVLDGKKLRIMSGSLHYFRLPSEYWRDRLRKLKAAGLNSVSTYVEWSFHQPEEDVNLFEGDQDVAKFVKIAAEEGLHVLLRPGPYICAERDLGGLPYWLLSKYPNIRLRTTNKDFIDETTKWMAKLFVHLTPLLYGNGGPIILVQVENEYGSYGKSKPYMEKIRDILKEHVGDNALLYTTDGYYRSFVQSGYVPETLTTVDFGPSDSPVINNFKDLRSLMPVGPLMNSEYYPGWLTHWSETLQQVSAERVVSTLSDMLQNNINFNFYMFFGGSNFEYSAGANYDQNYQPDITSYDYDAPLSEAGDPTPKYHAIRNEILKYNLETDNIPVPPPSKKGKYGLIKMNLKLNLLSNESRSTLGVKHTPVTGPRLPTFEALKQRSGLVLYETTLNEADGILEIMKPRDWVVVFVDYKLQGIINRMKKAYTLSIKSKPGSVLSLLVENQGRINYGFKIHDFKGILGPVVFNGKILEGPWTVIGYPLDLIKQPQFERNDDTIQDDIKQGPSLYEGHLILPQGEAPMDTFVDPTGWDKGFIFVNGRNIGRYWPGVGPQVTLYIPGVWLLPAPAENLIQIIELHRAPENPTLEFIDYPVLNRTGSLSQYIIFP